MTDLKVEMRLPVSAQVSVLLDVAERCDDIVDDVKQLPGWKDDGRLLGIMGVAEGQIARLKNIAANIVNPEPPSEETVEAVARAIYADEGFIGWENVNISRCHAFLSKARAAITAYHAELVEIDGQHRKSTVGSASFARRANILVSHFRSRPLTKRPRSFTEGCTDMSDDIDAKLDRIFAGEPERAPDPAVLSAENNRTLRNMCIALEDKNTELRRGIERIRAQVLSEDHWKVTYTTVIDLCTKLLAGEEIE